ncbi:hypothetical protein D3C78_139580 [compost metagenome]
MNRLALCALQESYSVKFGCSAERVVITGGHDRYVKSTNIKKHLVSVSFVLREEDFLYFRAFYQNWQLNPLPFLMKLIIEDDEYKDYIAQFVQNSCRFDELEGKIFKVSAQLTVFISPVVVLTSKPYPLYFIESVGTDFEIDEAIQKQVMSKTEKLEKIETSFAIASATIREALNTYVLDVERIETSFSIAGAQITVDNKSPVYINTSIDIECIETAFAITGAQITVENKPPVYISTSIDIERIETAFAITGAQITN